MLNMMTGCLVVVIGIEITMTVIQKYFNLKFYLFNLKFEIKSI